MSIKRIGGMYSYIHYDDTSLIKDRPRCPKCGRRKYIAISEGMSKATNGGAIWDCIECMVWFTTPPQSHVVNKGVKDERI